MKRFLFRLFKLALVVGIVYAAYNCIKIIPHNKCAVVFNKGEETPVAYLNSGFNFVYQGVFPDAIVIVYFNRSDTVSVKITGVLPGLENSGDAASCVTLDVTAAYTIDPQRISITKSGLSPDFVSSETARIGNDALYYELSVLFREKYDVKKFETDWKSYGTLSGRIKSSLEKRGITVTDITFNGLIYPGAETYGRSLKFAAELDAVKKSAVIRLTELEKRLELREYEEKFYLNELDQVSKKIKDNPDLLKYIYITKMAETGKLPEKAPDPFFYDMNKPDIKALEKKERKEIDNLR
jgi:hypothetical protein